MTSSLSLTPDQHRYLTEVPFSVNGYLKGGRASGKSATAILRMLSRIQAFPFADSVVVRKEWAQLTSLHRETLRFATKLFGTQAVGSASKPPMRVTVHQGEHVATIDFRIYDPNDPLAEENFRGSTWSFLLLDEAALFPDESVLADIGPSLRQASVPIEVVMTSNPFDCEWLRPYGDHEDWTPFLDAFGLPWVTFRSDFRQNAALGEAGMNNMFAALKRKMAVDPERGKSWFSGVDDSAFSEYFFQHCFSPQRSRIPLWDHVPDGWSRPQLAIDPGGTSPSACYLWTRALRTTLGGEPDDPKVFPKGSVVLLDEVDTCLGDDLDRVYTDSIPDFIIDRIIPMTESWGIRRPSGVVDDAALASTGHGASVADLFTTNGIALRPAKKGRREHGLAIMRSMLANAQPAGYREERGLYYTPRCRNFERTLPRLKTNPRNPEDHVTLNVPDHWADAARYAVVARQPTQTTVTPLQL